ncbi:MAG: 1-phosphofructokinase family hexose kinase [Erysipelotrichaceae bacterium]|nr:1-phosphofructokinase family hexose kinase [Erysipelotrichaceae bacterium]
MIYTVTLNPSVDLFVKTEIELGKLNRAESEQYIAGGKGINVSLLVEKLGIKSCAIGFVGGFTGEFIRNSLKGKVSEINMIECEGVSRINIKVEDEKELTEINLSGIKVGSQQKEELFEFLRNRLTEEDYLDISGNTARGFETEDIETLCRIANEKNARLVVDINEKYLKSLLKYRPFLIKPNIAELSGMTGRELSDPEELIEVMKDIHEQGIANVLVSMGGQGACLYDGNYERAEAFRGKVVSTIGSGDSMVAGFMYASEQGMTGRDKLIYATACGSATAFKLGLADKQEVEDLFNSYGKQ